jgi:hypothetical protein
MPLHPKPTETTLVFKNERRAEPMPVVLPTPAVVINQDSRDNGNMNLQPHLNNNQFNRPRHFQLIRTMKSHHQLKPLQDLGVYPDHPPRWSTSPLSCMKQPKILRRGNPMSSKLQTEHAYGATEAKYVALSQGLREVMPMLETLKELKVASFEYNTCLFVVAFLLLLGLLLLVCCC